MISCIKIRHPPQFLFIRVIFTTIVFDDFVKIINILTGK